MDTMASTRPALRRAVSNPDGPYTTPRNLFLASTAALQRLHFAFPSSPTVVGSPLAPSPDAIPFCHPFQTSATPNGPGGYEEGVITALAEHIEDLETLLFEAIELNAYIPTVEDALAAERGARRALMEAQSSLREEVVRLRAKVSDDSSRADELRVVLSLASAHPCSGAGPDVRTEDDYLAQVRCTLTARADVRAWQRRAAFWRRLALATGANAGVVTPSASALEDETLVARASLDERHADGDESVSSGQVAHSDGSIDFDSALPTLTLQSSLEESVSDPEECVRLSFALPSPSLPDTSLPAASSSMVLPALCDSPRSPTLRFFADPPPSPWDSPVASPSAPISASPSASSQASVKSRRRRAQVLPPFRSDFDSSASGWDSPTPSPLAESFSAACASALRRSPLSASVSYEDSDADPRRPPPYPDLPLVLAPDEHAARSALPTTLVADDADLVVVLHTDFSETSYAPTPELPSSSRSLSPLRAAEPEKNARLRAGLRAIKRLSTSLARPAPADASSIGYGRDRSASVAGPPGLAADAPPPWAGAGLSRTMPHAGAEQRVRAGLGLNMWDENEGLGAGPGAGKGQKAGKLQLFRKVSG
ncbi:uncharacterized protein BXZ73DRAFT_108401 [Epithele typhae]|uniref:uncharacterized protein n=1 Tax=Epithele typhae TaxID=378194 RepID=UPI002007B4FA|nr:uncharacterized protein BXZ73DRAFT_108401 [Epithele typhae]KAH9910883.1 hypothetical protein BXZ73DRAFT_108401 [Epithele typhae]